MMLYFAVIDLAFLLFYQKLIFFPPKFLLSLSFSHSLWNLLIELYLHLLALSSYLCLHVACRQQGHILWLTVCNKWAQLFLFVLNPYSLYCTLWGRDFAHDKFTSLYVCEELLSDMNRRKKCSFLFSTTNIAFLWLQRCMGLKGSCLGKKIIISRKDSLMLFVKRLMQIDSLLHSLVNCPKHVTEDGSAGKLWILAFMLILLWHVPLT